MKIILPKITALAAVAVFIGVVKTGSAAEQPARFDYTLGSAAVADAWVMVKKSTEATAWRLEERTVIEGKSRRIFHERVGTPVKLTLGQAARLQEALVEPLSLAGSMKLCGFDPVAEVEFAAGERRVAVQFCFGCGEISVAIDGRNVTIDSMSAAGRAQFLAVVKEVFPKDEVVQGIDKKLEQPRPLVPAKS